jgi:hypothetical protein
MFSQLFTSARGGLERERSATEEVPYVTYQGQSSKASRETYIYNVQLSDSG